jgi:hypothetical protein
VSGDIAVGLFSLVFTPIPCLFMFHLDPHACYARSVDAPVELSINAGGFGLGSNVFAWKRL